jgi:hypothetical protein
MRSLTFVALLVLLSAACGGRIEGGGDDDSGANSGGDSGTGEGGSGGDSMDFPLCPGQPPTMGTACTPPGQVCVYPAVGSEPCEALACTDQGSWQPTPSGC